MVTPNSKKSICEHLEDMLDDRECHGEMTGYQTKALEAVIKMLKDTDLTPEEVAELAKVKQEGRLIALPCKVGDTVYFAIPGCKISDAKVTGFWIADKWLQLQLSNGSTFTCWDGPEVYFGKTVFLTKEAAEKALVKKD